MGSEARSNFSISSQRQKSAHSSVRGLGNNAECKHFNVFVVVHFSICVSIRPIEEGLF